jgi:hypothetical protein
VPPSPASLPSSCSFCYLSRRPPTPLGLSHRDGRVLAGTGDQDAVEFTLEATASTSFVIASRNRAYELATTVARLLDSTGYPIIVVDNDSHDDSSPS